MGRCNTSHKKRGEVYGQETKEQAAEEAAMVHSDRAGRGVGSLAAGGVVPIDRTRAGQRGIGDSSSTGRVRGHPSAVPLPVIAGTDSGRTWRDLQRYCGQRIDPFDCRATGSVAIDG